ncbi:MAG: SUMF1/EgtB/PvdO family nonheme iron enzyme [Sphaerochaetaceae bacterium]
MKKRGDDMPVNIDPVRLKPLLGMQPGVYLTIIYAVVLVVVIFLVAFLPGILHSGKRVTFSSPVTPSVVEVDGHYIGSTPVTAFIEPGTHEAVFMYEDMAHESVEFQVSHPVFLTWLFPRRQHVASSSFLDTDSAFRNYLASMYGQVVAWSEPSPDDRYHRPPLFMQVAETVVASDISGIQDELFQFYSSAFAFITSQEMLSDANASLSLVNEMEILSDSQVGRLESTLVSAGKLLSETVSNESIGLSAYSTDIDFDRTSLSVPVQGFPAITGYSFGSAEFIKGDVVPAIYPSVNSMGIHATVEGFSLGALEITEYQWAQFVTNNPYWAKSNIDALVADGMVDTNYLAGIYPTTAVVSNKPIRNISWYAAQAFAEWLGEVTGRPVFLPSETQWEYAATSVADKPYLTGTIALADSNGPSAMLGGYWELVADSYIPLGRFLGTEGIWDSPLSGVIVKGGSYLNDPAKIGRTTVGVLSREECAETTGFRIAWTD